jgi:hypothetical protein
MANGTAGAGGVANYESISSIYGMETQEDGTICYVPERFPDNWYRRGTPYGVADLVAGLAPTYLSGPELVLPNPIGSLQNLGQAPEIGCAIYQGVTSGIPAALLGETNDKLSQTITFLQNQLLPQLPVSSLVVEQEAHTDSPERVRLQPVRAKFAGERNWWRTVRAVCRRRLRQQPIQPNLRLSEMK